jgi:two-component system sensor histidine kinase KdpD
MNTERPSKTGRRLLIAVNASAFSSYLLAMVAMACLTIANLLLSSFIGYRTVALNYLLGIVLLAFFVGRGPMLVAATVSALAWNFLFLPPRFTFSIHGFEDVMMFAMYFVIAIVLGQLIAKIRMQEEAERRKEEYSTALYLLTRELAQASNLDEIIKKFVAHVQSVFKGETAIVMAESPKLLKPGAHPASTLQLCNHEMNTARWVFTDRQETTSFSNKTRLTFLPLCAANERIGVLVVKLASHVASSPEYKNLLDSFARQAALVINRQQLQEYAEKTRLSAESERLGKNLLDSISHEMRTPIAAITSATGTLAELQRDDISTQQKLTEEIQLAAARLNRLVGNLLDIARVEAGHLKPKMDWCDVGDLVHIALKSVEKELSLHKVRVNVQKELPLVKMDLVLMEQALANLLLNAAHHTPAGTTVEINAAIDEDELAISVSDSGKGLPSDALERVFEKFYRVPGSPSGGTGLGLSIVKGFVEAQHGRVSAVNRIERGAVFTLFLPVTKAPTVSLPI